MHLTSTNNEDALYLVCGGKEKQERIYTSVEAANYLLNSYATDNVIGNSKLLLKLFKKYNSQTAVQLAEALEDKALRSVDAYSVK